MQGENWYLQDHLFECLGILMIPLPPYHPEINPTELVFNTLVQRLRSKQARSSSSTCADLPVDIELEMNQFSLSDTKIVL